MRLIARSDTTMSVESRSILMDVDTGVDDALAVILAHRSPGAQVVAIGTVTGNVSAAQAATNTLKTLDALGASTPGAAGARTWTIPTIGDSWCGRAGGRRPARAFAPA